MPSAPRRASAAPPGSHSSTLPRRCRWAGRHEEAQQRNHPAPLFRKPYEYDRVPKRDERFPDPYNMGVNAEVFFTIKISAEPKTLMIFTSGCARWMCPEMMASIITETVDKPWGYYAT